MSSASLADRLDLKIAADGPIPVSTYVDAALYDASHGFYAVAGQAGRRGDFLTAPEVGPLFGAVVSRAIDARWEAVGRPDPFVVEEWGAGPGTLARAIVAARGTALTAGALRWVQVEVSAQQRAQHLSHPQLSSVDPGAVVGAAVDLVFANELLDNMPFDIAEYDGTAWHELLIGPRDDDVFTLIAGPRVPDPDSWSLPAGCAPGTRLPVQRIAREWIATARTRAGAVVALDYGADTDALVARDGGWLRTHVSHDGRADWLIDPGTCDITTDVAIDQLLNGGTIQTQADWLQQHGIAPLVEEGRATWQASAGIGDLAALKARSRIREAEALLDPAGMGAFLVFEWGEPAQK